MPHYARAILHFFSGTGRTWQIARLYQNELSLLGIPCDMSPLELPTDAQPASDAEASLLHVIAVPTHGRDVSREISAWLNRLAPGNGRPAALAMTCATNQGHAAEHLARILGAGGFDVVHEALYVNGGQPWPTGTAASWLVADVHEAVGQILAGTRRTVSPAEGLAHPAALVRAGYWLAHRNPMRLLSVGNACDLCMTCLRFCPVGAISIARPQDAREGHALAVEISRACMLCLRCVVACPKGAITINHSWLLQGVQESVIAEPGYLEALERAHTEPLM